jgi:hypothetical protein
MVRLRWAGGGAVLAAALFASAFVPVGAPSAGGVWDGRERGCYCHAPDPSTAVGFTVTGLPGRYLPNSTYTIEITVTFTDVAAVANKSQGGFYLEATAGSFSVPLAMDGLVQVRGLQVTHTQNGSLRRDWQVLWTAPATPDQVITFYAFVNTVNGNKSETFGSDHWTSKTIRIGVSDQPQITGPPAPSPPLALETIGLLIFAVIAGGYALYTFYTVRKPAGKEDPDNRQPRGRKKRKRGD